MKHTVTVEELDGFTVSALLASDSGSNINKKKSLKVVTTVGSNWVTYEVEVAGICQNFSELDSAIKFFNEG